MWCLGAWFNGGLGSGGLAIGADLKEFFQPKQFSDADSKELKSKVCSFLWLTV